MNIGRLSRKKLRVPLINMYDVEGETLTLFSLNIKIELSSPAHGFGGDIYPKVVTDISMSNAQVLMAQAAATPDNPATGAIQEMPPQPYSPKVKTMQVSYKAERELNFNLKNTSFEIFHHTAFLSYKTYPLELPFTPSSYTSPADVEFTRPSYNTLLPSHTQGTLYFKLQKVAAPCNLSLYFSLAESSVLSSEKCRFYYLSTSGWKELPLLADSTGNFSYSGLIQVSIPSDI